MATEGEATNKDTTTYYTREVPGHTHDFVRSRVLHYVGQTKCFSTKITQAVGQDAAKLVLNCGATAKKRDHLQDGNQDEEENVTDGKTTNTILVGNIPPKADEEILELLFESKKKSGGGPVKNIQFNRLQNWAIIEFSEPKTVEDVISKLSITLMDTELNVNPYIPLLQGDGWIESLELRGLSKQLTKDLVAKYIEAKIGSVEASGAEYISEDEDEETVEETRETVEQITGLKSVKLRMLKALNYVESVSQQFPNVKMKINHRKNEINFYGNVAEILPLKLDLYEKLSTFSVYTFDGIAPTFTKLFKSTKVTEYINKKLMTNKLVCTWEAEGQTLVICSLEEDIAKCCRIMSGSVKEEKFPVCKESGVAFLPSTWPNKQEELRKQNEFVCNVSTDEDTIEVQIIAQDDTVRKIVQEVKAFVKQQTKLDTETIEFDRSSRFGSVYKGLCDLGIESELLHKISKDLTMYHVSIENESKVYTDYVYIKGTFEGRELAKKRIRHINL